MDASPKGREIRTVEGEPGGIETRGRKIAELGATMASCADTLQMIASHDLANGEMDGKAVGELQEKIGDSYGTLREASDLYGPVGPIIEAYGKALGSVKGPLNGQVQTCEDLWAKYDAMEGAPTHLIPGTEPEAGSPEAAAEEEAAQAKEQARADWEDAAGTWDGYYDTWEDAYDEAVNGIGNEMAGKIKDGWWEVLDDIIAVLEFIGFVLFIAGMFIAGPIAAIALVVAALVFIGKLSKAIWDGGDWEDVAWAALDLIPFGKFGKIGDAVGALDDSATFGKKFVAGFKVAGGVEDAWKLKSFPDVMTSLHTGLDVADFERLGSYAKPALAALEIQGVLAKQAGGYKSAVEAVGDAPNTFTDNPFG